MPVFSGVPHTYFSVSGCCEIPWSGFRKTVGCNCYGSFSLPEPPPLKLLSPSGVTSNDGEDNTADFFHPIVIFKDFFLLCLVLFCPYFVTIAYRGRGVLQANSLIFLFFFFLFLPYVLKFLFIIFFSTFMNLCIVETSKCMICSNSLNILNRVLDSLVAQLVKNLQCRFNGFDQWVERIPQRRKWQTTPVSLPGKSHG